MSGVRDISLGDDFGEVIVNVNHARIAVHADGRVETYPGVTTNGQAANYSGKATAASPAELKPGAWMADGTVYAGISPDTQHPMYTTPGDAPLTYTFNEARKYAAELEAHGHQDWRMPTKGELDVLFNNRAVIGGLNLTGSAPAGSYWSSTQSWFGTSAVLRASATVSGILTSRPTIRPCGACGGERLLFGFRRIVTVQIQAGQIRLW